ncbi:hypothetical protein V5O48_007477 [Marasmius crinis-equi]|uniref:F-box domain-containing protein n=1 Tax=Marasmius crinis-equi TaxID=585013 RepID=A0ABR3FGK8_9AGAR
MSEDIHQPSGLNNFVDDSDAEEEIVQIKNTKRLRDSEHSGPQSKKKRRCKPSLPTMPLDILYTIFGYLPPKSLLALAKVNHSFRETLLSPETTFIWTQTRRLCKAPDPFPGMPEIAWIRLLFGRSRCQAEDVPATQATTPKAQLDEVVECMSACKNTKELETYVKARQEHLVQLRAYADLCEKWKYDDSQSQVEDAAIIRQARYEALRSRLEALGYTDVDIASVKRNNQVYKDKPLTDVAWTRMKKEITHSVLNFRVCRLLDSKDPKPSFLTSRCDLISEHFFAYLQTLTLPE